MELKYLILHCSDEPNNRKTKGSDILRWHTTPKPKGRGWKRAGYEQVIRRDGFIDVLYKNNGDGIVDGFEITNGARGFNSESRHICLIGGVDKDGGHNLDMSNEQHDSLVGVVKDTIMECPDVKIGGHYNFSSKTCPNFNVQDWLIEVGVSENNIKR